MLTMDQFTTPIGAAVVNATIIMLVNSDTTTLSSSDGNQTAITHTNSSVENYIIYILESATKGFSKMSFKTWW